MPGRIDDPDREDSTDSSINGLIGRLGSVSRIQVKQNERMTAIGNALANPPNIDEERQLREQTTAIRAAAQATLDQVGQIETKLTPR